MSHWRVSMTIGVLIHNKVVGKADGRMEVYVLRMSPVKCRSAIQAPKVSISQCRGKGAILNAQEEALVERDIPGLRKPRKGKPGVNPC